MQEPGRAQCLCLLTTACRYFSDISHYEFGKMFVTRITLSNAFKKNYTNEQMMSKCFSAEFPRALNPGAGELVQRCLNKLHAIRACFRKHNIVSFIC